MIGALAPAIVGFTLDVGIWALEGKVTAFVAPYTGVSF